ncbi:MAG: threonine/homoserine/homoserine lactone efflux protein [Halioglobus sp.]
MELSHWLSLISICLLGAMSPGPSLTVVLKSTLDGGQPQGYAAALAHGFGVAVYGLLTVTGLAVLITSSPPLFLTLQVLGAGYLIYLGIKSLRSEGHTGVQSVTQSIRSNAAMQGFLVALLNPKLAIFMLALFSQFLQPGYAVQEKSIMVATAGITDACWYSLIVTLVSRKTFLEKLQRSSRIIDRVFGVILIALALTVLLRALL